MLIPRRGHWYNSEITKELPCYWACSKVTGSSPQALPGQNVLSLPNARRNWPTELSKLKSKTQEPYLAETQAQQDKAGGCETFR